MWGAMECNRYGDAMECDRYLVQARNVAAGVIMGVQRDGTMVACLFISFICTQEVYTK